MSVKRYEWVSCDEHACHCDVVESAEGDMVDYEDYAALEVRCAALAAENAELLPKAASELSNAWVLHKYLIGIQAAIMYLDNGNKMAAQEWLYVTIAGPGFEFPDGVDDIDAWATHQMRGSVSHQQALEIIKAETPATDAFLAEVRASAITDALKSLDGVFDTDCVMESNGISYEDAEQRTAGAYAVSKALDEFAAQLRKGVQP
ncbi:hypothetical protein CF309_001792 [Enterobacter kobei]|nr:hypothetical protein [Enterobacter kobei]